MKKLIIGKIYCDVLEFNIANCYLENNLTFVFGYEYNYTIKQYLPILFIVTNSRDFDLYEDKYKDIVYNNINDLIQINDKLNNEQIITL